jgi:hypothetical protein
VAAAFFLFYFFFKMPPLKGAKKIFFYFLFYANLGAKIQVAADLAVTKPSILPRNFNEIRKVYDYLHYMKNTTGASIIPPVVLLILHILFKILIILFEILIILFEIPIILFPPTLQSRSPRQLWFKGTHA